MQIGVVDSATVRNQMIAEETSSVQKLTIIIMDWGELKMKGQSTAKAHMMRGIK